MTTRTDTTASSAFSAEADNTTNTQLLEKRLLAWKHVVKDYIQHFEEVASAEESFAKSLTRTQSTLTIPFKEHQFFIPETEPGMQQLTLAFKDYHHELSQFYTKTSKSITNETIKDLNTLKSDIKRRHKEIEAEYEKINKSLNRSHTVTQEQFVSLSRAMEPTTSETSTRHDPWLVNHDLKRQLEKNVTEENSYIKAMQSSTHSLSVFEESIVSCLKKILRNYFEWKGKNMADLSAFSTKMDTIATSFPDNLEWTKFGQAHPNVIPEENLKRTMSDVTYPERDNPLLDTTKSGPLKHKSGIGPFKSYKDHYAYLTPTGFLHGFPSSELHLHKEPDFTIDLSHSTLGPSPALGDTGFEITHKSSGKLFKSDTDYELKFNTHEEAIEWWEEISKKAEGVIRPGNSSNVPPVTTAPTSAVAGTAAATTFATTAPATDAKIAPLTPVADTNVASAVTNPTEDPTSAAPPYVSEVKNADAAVATPLTPPTATTNAPPVDPVAHAPAVNSKTASSPPVAHATGPNLIPGGGK